HVPATQSWANTPLLPQAVSPSRRVKSSGSHSPQLPFQHTCSAAHVLTSHWPPTQVLALRLSAVHSAVPSVHSQAPVSALQTGVSPEQVSETVHCPSESQLRNVESEQENACSVQPQVPVSAIQIGSSPTHGS